MQKLPVCLALLAVLSASGCRDEAEPIPAYLRIEPFTVNAAGGAAFQKITEGWLYVNGELLGAYTLPADVPVLAEGEGEILVYPGIKENGILATPGIYFPLQRHRQTTVLTPGETTVVQPVTAYEPTIKFGPWGEAGKTFDNGEGAGLINRDSDIDRSFVISDIDAFDGKSVRLIVDPAHPLIEIATDAVELPTSATLQVWLELHYFTNIPFQLSLRGTTGASSEIQQDIYQFNAKEGWNKIYISLQDALVLSRQEEYRLFFRVSLPIENGQYTVQEGRVLLDNIKLVYF